MAQARATGKMLRYYNLLTTSLVGHPLLRDNSLQASERAALRYRRASKRAKQRPAQEVVFLVPLVGPDHVTDWQAVQDRLHETLNSFLRQSNPNWRAVICCQKRPDLPNDERLTYLPFDDPTPGNDKWRKLADLCSALPNIAENAAYVMSFDADDILHPGSVAEMLTRQEMGGYLVQAGYVLNHATGAIGLADAPSVLKPLRKPFWKLCGSCTALYYDPALPEAAVFLNEMTQHEHRMFPYLAQLAGRRLTPLSHPSVLYVLNHGENFGARRGRVSFKARFVERFRVTDPARLGQIAKDYAIT